MRPISLRRRPPRDPRARLAGLMVLPRTIDKARAALTGGDPGDYTIAPGLCAWLLERIGIGEADFVELVRRAAGDDEVARIVAGRVSPERCEALNAVIQAARVRDVPPDERDRLVRCTTPPRENARLIDVLVEDDRRLLTESLTLKTVCG
ncbi:MAG TPA: DUF5069 domain-containing protein [Candidatus Elarobacter sp.]|jgi:hypothetical protein|nr:DUF5069 domain-containing protein [Candidatus Elarobacter sp.]